MTAPGTVRMDASPISVVTANAHATHPHEQKPTHAALDTLSRDGFEEINAAEKARALPRKLWLIVAAGLVAWAVVAIPAWLIFG